MDEEMIKEMEDQLDELKAILFEIENDKPKWIAVREQELAAALAKLQQREAGPGNNSMFDLIRGLIMELEIQPDIPYQREIDRINNRIAKLEETLEENNGD